MLKIVVHTLDKFGHGGYNEAVNPARLRAFMHKKLLFPLGNSRAARRSAGAPHSGRGRTSPTTTLNLEVEE